MAARTRMRSATATAVVVLGLLALPAGAGAAIPNVFGTATCTPAGDGVRECSAEVPSFDGTPIDINAAFPPEPASGPDGDYPLIMVFHGWGGEKASFGALRWWTNRGYAAFSMTDRGFGASCGEPTDVLVPACSNGYIHLMDTRWEVRDAQYFAGTLADESLIDPQRIGSIGGSYGGGISMALAALRNRQMQADGSLVPWTSPLGIPMRIAAATPEIPWTDLAYSLAPNGSFLDYLTDNPYRGTPGVLKQSFVAGLFAAGLATGRYTPAGDPSADLPTWYARINAGEPYDDPVVPGMIEELTTHHSSYYIDDSIAPAPLLISNGWTDDLFPADEAIRFYNRTRAHHPATPISLFFLDYGHQRGTGRPADINVLRAQQDAWFAHFVRGDGPAPFVGVTAITQTCPREAPSGGPFQAADWGLIAPGEVRHTATGSQTIAPSPGNPGLGLTFDPIAGGGNACASSDASDQGGAATYRLDPAPASGYTLIGSPTITAAIDSPSPTSQIAARLLDVAPDNTQTLVARAVYRPGVNPIDGGREVFQLHANGWHFAAGHIAKLELLGTDAPYARASNGQGPVTVTDLTLRLPVRERPGTGNGVVVIPAPKPIPDPGTLAPGFRRSRIALRRGTFVRVRRGRILVPVSCRGNNGACTASIAVRTGFGKGARRRSVRIANRPVFTVSQNKGRVLRLGLTKAGRTLFRNRRRARVRINLRSEAGNTTATRIAIPKPTGGP